MMVGSLGLGEPILEGQHISETSVANPKAANPPAGNPAQQLAAPVVPQNLVKQFAQEYFKIYPFTNDHLSPIQDIFKFLSNPSSSDPQKLGELVQKTAGFFPASSQFSKDANRADLVQAMQAFAASTNPDDKSALEGIADRIKVKEELLKISEQADGKKESDKIAQEKAAKEKAAQDAQLQALQQQALLAAAAQVNQGNQGGGGSGSGSGSGSNSKGSSSPQSSNSNSDSQPKHDNLADQLSRAFSQNNQNQNLSSLFNNNNSNSSSSSSEKKKDDGFKFDVSPKNSQNEVKPVSAKTNAEDPSAAMDPSASQSVNPSLQNVLSGPTSVPRLMSQASPNYPFGLGEEGGGAGKGFSGNIKTNGAGGESGNAQEIFSGVGKVDYGELPPPIRKASPDFGGEGGGMGESSEGGSASNSPKAKKESLVNELVLMTNNPRAKGRGIMAFVGVQVKDVCTKKPGIKKIGVCGLSKEKNRFERVSVFR